MSGIGNFNYSKDKRRESKVTCVYIELITKTDTSIKSFEYAPDKKFPYWDIIQRYNNGASEKIELKEDLSAKKWGNIFVETECRGKFSGITISEADYFVYIVHTSLEEILILKIPTNSLKEIMNKSGKFKQGAGDKGSNTKGFTIPINLLYDYKVSSIAEKEFEEMIKNEFSRVEK